jgi:glycosyltransferase involved in cell wall biosynthesis
MLVSIIITNFNYSEFLIQCLESCLNQNFIKNNYEIIFVDDCSTDNSVNLIKKFSKKKNLKIIINKKNLGVAESSNIAILKSDGKFIVRVDSDDYVEPDFIKVLYNYISVKNNFLGVTCNYTYVDINNKRLHVVDYRSKPISCALMYNKNKLLRYGLYNKHFKHREEEELRKRVGKRYILGHIAQALYNYRMHDKNKTKNKFLMESYRKKLVELY